MQRCLIKIESEDYGESLKRLKELENDHIDKIQNMKKLYFNQIICCLRIKDYE